MGESGVVVGGYYDSFGGNDLRSWGVSSVRRGGGEGDSLVVGCGRYGCDSVGGGECYVGMVGVG